MGGIVYTVERRPIWTRLLTASCALAAVVVWAWWAAGGATAPGAPAAPSTILRGSDLQVGQSPPEVSPSRAPAGAVPAEAQTATALAPPPNTAAVAPQVAADDYAARNARVDARLLTTTRPLAARAFLSEVLLASDTRSGFVVAAVLPGSRYERMGLQLGDIVYTLDTAESASVDESSIVAMTLQREITLDVYRQGNLLHLKTSLL